MSAVWRLLYIGPTTDLASVCDDYKRRTSLTPTDRRVDVVVNETGVPAIGMAYGLQ